MAEETFSFRWGIPLLDEGDTRIPNFFFNHYTDAGVARMEFLTILHLARYQFEKAGSECRPSVGTVAKQMGYTVRGLQKVLAGMEKRRLLTRHYRPGDTTIYDFTGFSRAILAIELSARGEPQFTPTPEPQFTPGMNPSSSKEEQQEKQTRNGDGELTKEQEHTLALLLDIRGMNPVVARRWVQSHEPGYINSWVKDAKSKPDLHNPAGYIGAMLKTGKPASSPPRDRTDPRGYAQDGDIVMCPECFTMHWYTAMCPECRRCDGCCECEKAES